MAATTTKKRLTKKTPTGGSSMVPEAAYYDEYVSRMIELDLSDLELFYRSMYGSVPRNVLAEGPTGPGKTSAFLAFAAKHGLPFYSVPSGSGIDPVTLFGKWVPGSDVPWRWADGMVTRIVRNGGVLLVNEINLMPDRVASVLFGLFDKRREIQLLDRGDDGRPDTIITVRAHRQNCWCDLPADECRKRWVLLAADMNPDYAGTRPLNAALRNRFAVQIDWGYDSKVEEALVPLPTLRKIAKQIRESPARFTTPFSTNMMMEFAGIAGEMGLSFAISNLANHFPPRERASVRQMLDLDKAKLDNEVKSACSTRRVSGDDLERLKNLKPGEADPEFGVLGVDWVYADDEEGEEFDDPEY